MAFIRYWTPRTELAVNRLLGWIGLGRGKFAAWQARYGRVNEPNAWIPRDFWLEDWEKQAIIDVYQAQPQDGYRRITYRMLDADIGAVSPASVYRVLKNAGLLRVWIAFPRQPGFSSLTSTAASPGERRLTLTFVNYNQTPQCPSPAEPVHGNLQTPIFPEAAGTFSV